uniref:Histone H1.9 n=1 Tax=Marmota marmota marmota TaxID=9994 RepID=A0A8C6A8E0_MARMA
SWGKGTLWHSTQRALLLSTLPRRELWGHCDLCRILVASQCLPEVTTEINPPPPDPTAQDCGGQPWVIILGPPSSHPGQDAESHLAAVPIRTLGFKRCHGWRPAGQRIRSHRKLSMSKVIMRAMAEKGTRRRVSLAALKKAVTNNGYNMAHNIWRFKRELKKLVDNGMLQRVTGRGTSGSFRLGKKRASKLKAKRRQQQRRRRRRRPGHGRSGQRQSGQRRSLLGSKQGHKRLFKGVRRVAKCRRH